jgi:hypothetical protein
MADELVVRSPEILAANAEDTTAAEKRPHQGSDRPPSPDAGSYCSYGRRHSPSRCAG